MTENKNQTELQQLITGELLEVIIRIAALSVGSFPNETCERAFVEGLKNIINSEVDLAWESVKLLNKLDKKTPQDVLRDQELIISIDGKQLAKSVIGEINKLHKKEIRIIPC